MISLRNPAPIALFAYNRPDHLRQTVAALADNALARESHLHVFLDGVKGEEDSAPVADIRQYVPRIKGFKSVSLTEREKNQGLAASIIGGVSSLLEKVERIIVLEDDIVTAPSFLEYMNEALDMYESDWEVASVHGFMYEIDALPETFFLKGTDCWGWATWRRAWRMFDPDGPALLRQLAEEGLLDAFDLEGAVHNTQMLRDQIEGRNNSWAIRWHASAFLQNMLTLHPGHSLVRNIGLDGSGTHCHNVPSYLRVRTNTRPINIERLPLIENEVARAKIVEFLTKKKGAGNLEKGLVRSALQALRLAFKSKHS